MKNIKISIADLKEMLKLQKKDGKKEVATDDSYRYSKTYYNNPILDKDKKIWVNIFHKKDGVDCLRLVRFSPDEFDKIKNDFMLVEDIEEPWLGFEPIFIKIQTKEEIKKEKELQKKLKKEKKNKIVEVVLEEKKPRKYKKKDNLLNNISMKPKKEKKERKQRSDKGKERKPRSDKGQKRGKRSKK